MIIYNVTTMLAWQINEEWVNWMQQKHIPDIMATGCFNNYSFLKLLEIEEEDGPTYAIQFFANKKEDYEKYIANHSTQLRQKGHSKWGNQVVSFRSLMELVDRG